VAFKGDLTNISLFDVFQTLNQNKQAGVLVLSHDGITKKISIAPEGVRIFFTRSFRTMRLGEIFVCRGRITPQDVEILLLEQKKKYRPLGELLVEAGKVTQDEVDSVLRYHAEDEIFEVFSWESGNFSFYDGQDIGESTTPLSDILMDPAGLCLEAARRLDEMERLREAIPTNDEYYARVAGAAPDAQINVAAQGVFDALAEASSVDDLRDLVGLSLYDTLTAVQELLSAELIRPCTVDELLEAGRHARDTGQNMQAAKLLEKAHELYPSDRGILEECVQAIERLGEPRRLAKYLAILGSICLDEGEIDEAIDYLEQTLRSDSTHFGALISLREAFIRQEDTERVAEISLKIARAHSEQGDLASAIESCRQGLDVAPTALALRFYHAQLLARTDYVEEARAEIHTLIQETEHTRKATRNEKAQELLASCYRLLLRIDPDDEDAKLGMRDLDRRRMSSLRRRKLALRGGIAAAATFLLVAIGFSLRGSGPAEILQDVEEARQRGNHTEALELIDELLTDHPDSPEAQAALNLRTQIQEQNSSFATARRKREQLLRAELDGKLADVREALSDRHYLVALDPVKEFLAILQRQEVAFLRRKYGPLIEYELITFLERVENRFDADRQQVAAAEALLKQYEGKNAEELRGLEKRLAFVLRRDWTNLLPDLTASLKTIADSRYVGKAERKIEEFNQRAETVQAVFDSLHPLYYRVRSDRMRAEITILVKIARTRGKNLLMDCEFAKARKVYDDAYRAAHAVDLAEPRKYFLDLLNWLEAHNITEKMGVERRKIDNVVATLADVEKLVESGKTDAAYRLLRDVVSEYRLIRFEKKYKMPYAVTSTPDSAEVFVNGESIGRTPCTISMEISQRPVLVRLVREGFERTDARLVPIDPDLKGKLDVALVKLLAWEKELTVSGIEAAPVIANGRVLLATTNASLLALDLKSGERLWEAPTNLLHRITARPVVAGDVAYLITVAGALHRVQLADGKIEKLFDLEDRVHHDAVHIDDTLYVVTGKPSLVAVRNGAVAWSAPLAFNPSTRIIAKDGLLCVGTVKGHLLVHNAKTGEETARLKAPSGDTSFFGGLARHGDLVLAGAEDGKLYAFDIAKGKLRWTYPTTGPLAAPAVSDGERIYLGARDGYIHVLSENGREVATLDMGYAVLTEPALAGEFLYVLGSNRVKAFATDGGGWWEQPFERWNPKHVVVGEGYTVVVTNKPWVYAFPRDIK
jgi:outer membrane protein assembly factor BamB/tetratricopeptide (TPR) repeat protein